AASDVLDCVDALVTQSLLKQIEPSVAEPRFWMLETIREFALDELVAHAEADNVLLAHADYFLAYTERVAPALRGGDQESCLAMLQAEHDNLRAVISYAIEKRHVDTAMRLGAAIWKFWEIQGHFT